MDHYDRFFEVAVTAVFCLAVTGLVLVVSGLIVGSTIRSTCDSTCSSLGYAYSTHYGIVCDCADEPFQEH